MKIRDFILFTLGVLYIAPGNAQQTRFEQSGGKETATYQEIIAWYQWLDSISPLVEMQEAGPTDAAYPLHLVKITPRTPLQQPSVKPSAPIKLFINNGIHPGEPDGIDASMLYARDLATGKLQLPVNTILYIIPVYNIGGCLNRQTLVRVNQSGPEAYGFRGNSQNLDLNRDYIKADSKEALTLNHIFQQIQPDLFLETHVSDGADFQHTLTLISTQYNKLGSLGSWMRQVFEPALYTKMQDKGWPMVPYIDFSNHDPAKGIDMFFDAPRFSTGYASLFNCMGWMTETHMLKPYTQRVLATFDFIQAFVQLSGANVKSILDNRNQANVELQAQDSFTLSWKLDTTHHRNIKFLGYETSVYKSEATGLPAMKFEHDKPFTKTLPYYDGYVPVKKISAPKAYILPRGWTKIVERLKANGIKMVELQSDSLIEVSSYQIASYQTYQTAFESHYKHYGVKISSKKESIRFLKGDYLIYLNQPAKRYLVETLEPEAEDGFFAWNFFDAILMQKEGYSDYRWDPLAAAYLEKNPLLKAQLAKKLQAEPDFAADHAKILEYIYKNSPYYEKAHLQYPVYRIEP